MLSNFLIHSDAYRLSLIGHGLDESVECFWRGYRFLNRVIDQKRLLDWDTHESLFLS